jgi:hypothetical protein
VPDGTYVYRRIVPEWWIPDGNGGHRLTSAAFIDRQGYVSIGVGEVLTEMSLSPEASLAAHEGYGLAQLGVSWIRSDLNLGMTREPTDLEPWHGALHGKKTPGKKTLLSKNAKILIEPSLTAE